MDHIEKGFTQRAQDSLTQLLKTSVDKSLNVNTVVIRPSDISGALLNVASKTKADSIVMASHGRGGIKQILLGSETLQVYLFKGMGTVLQSLEGQIALDIMYEGSAAGIPVLPVHDSFLTIDAHEDWLREQMEYQWSRHTNDHGVKPRIEKK